MSLTTDAVLLARLAILPLALAEIGIFTWYMRCLRKFPLNSFKRISALIVLVFGGLLVLVLQKEIYFWIAAAQPMKDTVVELVMITQGIICIGIVFYYLKNT